MSMFRPRSFKAGFGFGLCGLLLAALPAIAFDTGKTHVQMRLLDGGGSAGVYLAGVELVLDEGWKTYWRHPGDSGLPPKFDFSRSENVAAVEVKWPAPTVHHDGYGWVIGYEREVVFPLVITPKDEARPVQLFMDLEYGVCRDICIPMEGQGQLVLSGVGEHRAEVEAFLSRVPVPVESDDPRGGIASVDWGGAADEPAIDILVRLPKSANAPLLIVEGPADWHLPLPEMTEARADGTTVFRLALDELSQEEFTGTTLTMTGVGTAFSFEQAVTID